MSDELTEGAAAFDDVLRMGVEQVEKPALARHQFAEHGLVLVAAVANGNDRAILPEGPAAPLPYATTIKKAGSLIWPGN
jgi:hypothetical protein